MTFVGNLTRDAEVRYSQGGQAILTANVANSQGYGDKQTTLFIRCSLFGKRAEGNLVDYLKKGQAVLVSGELRQSEYNAQDGTMKTSLELNANILDLIGRRNEQKDNQEPNNTRNFGQSTGSKFEPQPQYATSKDNFADDYNDDLPF